MAANSKSELGSENIKVSLSHEERTATQPRSPTSRAVCVFAILGVSEDVRRIRLEVFPDDSVEGGERRIRFEAGQWLDVFIPGLSKAGGFTITSTPAEALGLGNKLGKFDEELWHINGGAMRGPYLDLAIQRSANPAASWFWQEKDNILGARLQVRVGGNFCWPPPGDISNVGRVVLIAGGLGINPLFSIASQIALSNVDVDVQILYSSKLPSNGASGMLFLPQLLQSSHHSGRAMTSARLVLKLFVTSHASGFNREQPNAEDLADFCSDEIRYRRIETHDLLEAVGDEPQHGSKKTVCYVCGPAEMSDHFVDFLHQQTHLSPESVFCEKWW